MAQQIDPTVDYPSDAFGKINNLINEHNDISTGIEEGFPIEQIISNLTFTSPEEGQALIIGPDNTIINGQPVSGGGGGGVTGHLDSEGYIVIDDNIMAASQSLASSGTVVLGVEQIYPINTSGAVTNAAMPVGTYDGQQVKLLNISNNSITFHATTSTSRVADGSSSVIAAKTAATFIWYAGDARWYSIGA